jgi:hypothetical protein
MLVCVKWRSMRDPLSCVLALWSLAIVLHAAPIHAALACTPRQAQAQLKLFQIAMARSQHGLWTACANHDWLKVLAGTLIVYVN